jgi:hypothetical protein
MPGKSHRLLITVTKQEHQMLTRAAKVEGVELGFRLPVATYIRRAAVLAAQAKLSEVKP